jgi:hypothetical protein
LLLADIVRTAVLERLNQDAYQRVLKQERRVRAELARRLG